MTQWQRVAAIDIGTVTCRLLIADSDGSTLKELSKITRITNLGEDVDATGMLKPEAIERVCTAIDEFRDEMKRIEALDGCKVEKIRCFATSASRDASNADVFAAELAKRSIELGVISGDTEAHLSFLGASQDFPNECLMEVDSGGGSTEVIVGYAGEKPLFAHSFNIGCRRVTERFFKSNPPAREEIEAARTWIQEQLAPKFQQMREQSLAPTRILMVAGTATSMVSIREKMDVYDASRVHGACVSLQELVDTFEMLAALPLAEREAVCGLQPQRAAVIVGGALILQEVLKAAGASSYTACETDILQGIILAAIKE